MSMGLFLSMLAVAGQLLFHPDVEYYGKNQYKADAQNWTVAEGRPGEIFVGNDQGLLHFDGYRWELSRLPGGAPVYSILVDEDRVYTGGLREFGYWTRSRRGMLEYTSLSALDEMGRLGEDEIWTILKKDGKVLFHAFRSTHVYDGEGIQTHSMPSFTMSPQILENGQLLVWQRGEGPSVLETDGTLHPFPEPPFQSPLVSIIPAGDGSSFVFTYREGIFRMEGDTYTPFPTEADPLMRDLVVRSALINPYTGDLIIGTHLGGVFSISREGKLLWRINAQSNNLPDDHIFGMTLDHFGNLWLAMRQGVARTSLRMPVWWSSELDPALGAVNTLAYKAPYLYMGTSMGLFRGTFSEDFMQVDRIAQVDNVVRNVMDITQQDGQLLCGSNGPTYEIRPDGVLPISPIGGGAEFDKGVIHGQEVLVQRTYSALCIYLKEQGRWKFSHRLQGFTEPVRSVKIDNDGAIWVRVLYRGLFRLQLDETLTQVSSITEYGNLGDANAPDASVFRFRNRLLFTDGTSGWYTFDDLLGQIVPFDKLEGWADVLSIEQFSMEDYAFRLTEGTVFVRERGDSLQVVQAISQKMLGGTVPDNTPRIVRLPGDRYLFLREKTLAICTVANERAERCDSCSRLSLTRFTAHDLDNPSDSLLPLDGGRLRIPWQLRNLTLQYGFPRFGLQYEPRFRYCLNQGRENGRSQDLGDVPEITLTHLQDGRYSITVEALSMDGEVLSSYTHSFVIRPPVYRSTPMILLYILLAAGLLFAAWWFLSRLYTLRRQIEVKHLESELQKAELEAVHTELTVKTFDIIHWNEVLQRIKDTLGQQKDRLGKDYPDKDYRAVCALIDKEMVVADSDWNAFEEKINLAYDNLIRRLREACPQLTETDLRYLAFLKMGKSNREVASVMNITIRGAEGARHRIKKKLDLGPDDSLEEFINSF